jgi:hypothetical protein
VTAWVEMATEKERDDEQPPGDTRDCSPFVSGSTPPIGVT